MKPTIIIMCLLLGEGLSVYVELLGAYKASISAITTSCFIKMSLAITVAGILLVAGYMYGMQYYQNIWVPTVITLTLALIVEPILAYAIFKQLPTVGSFIGFVLGSIGLICTLIF